MKEHLQHVKQSQLIKEFQETDIDAVLIRKLICYISSQNYIVKKESAWDDVLLRIFGIITSNTDIGNERTLLASQAFSALLLTHCTSCEPKESLSHILQANILENDKICLMDVEFIISDVELLKVIIAHGYLHLHRKEKHFNNIDLLIYNILYTHCIKYTRYSYIAFKILNVWLTKTMVTDFWKENDLFVEKGLESIIFSNWCHAISDVSKQNATEIFNTYLKIMEEKYNGFLNHIFECCVKRMSWQNEVKYIILIEICNVWNNVEIVTKSNVILPLFTCLTKSYMRHVATKVYMSLLKKLDEDKWKQSFGHIVKFVVNNWESNLDNNQNDIQVLCKYWLEPTIKKYRGILPYLWNLCKDSQSCIFQSYLHRVASEIQIELPGKFDLLLYMGHRGEVVRLNSFIVYCSRLDKLMETMEPDPFIPVKQFLWYNANTTSIYLREGIIKHFEVFYINLLKLNYLNDRNTEHVASMISWLHEFILDCFEIGSCYQRKILGLNLYDIILSLATDCKDSRQKKLLSRGQLQRKHLLVSTNHEFTDRTSLFLLLRLVLDTALDVKDTSSRVIVNYFNARKLLEAEKKVLFEVALKYCNSSKFYEIESGATLMKILAAWFPEECQDYLNTSCETVQADGHKACLAYSEFFLLEAQNQLTQMKHDPLKAIVNNMPFYGVLHALLKVGFQCGPESPYMTVSFAEKLLNLLEDAVHFFLSVLSSKSADTEYSSSFAEMGLAIDDAIKTSGIGDNEYDELNLSPAHRVILSCIWMSLKVSCDICCEMGMLCYSPESVHRNMSLIADVSRKCRHKGAVEVAGSVIGTLSRCLHGKDVYCDLPRTYIKKLLEKDERSTLNLTRRGAGLSIMFHRIVVSDNRRERPLVHYAVTALLRSLEKGDCRDENLDCRHDLPTARHLHFLRALVADKEIHAHLVPYMGRISLLCFAYLQSKVWVIRNASLQLFGAVVPRLVGQTAGGKTLSFGNGYTFDHFVTHYPMLADHVMTQIRSFSSLSPDYSTVLEKSSSIVHVLILLSKMFCGGCDLTDYSSKSFLMELRSKLPLLFANPVAHIRLLAAKVYAAATTLSSIQMEANKFMTIIWQERNANTLHGYLLAVHYLKQKFDAEWKSNLTDTNVELCYEKYDELLKNRCTSILNVWKGLIQYSEVQPICYSSEVMLFQLFESKTTLRFMLPILISTVSRNDFNFSTERVKPGFNEFIDVLMGQMARYIESNKAVYRECISNIIDSSRGELIISFLNNTIHSGTLLEILLNHLLYKLDECQELVINSMVTCAIKCLKELLSNPPSANLREQSLKLIMDIKSEKLRRPSLVHLRNVLIARFCEDEEVLGKTFSHMLDACIHKEEEFRHKAAECLIFSFPRFSALNEQNRIVVSQCCLILLKDEIFDIRELIETNLSLLNLRGVHNLTFTHNEIIFTHMLLRMLPDCLSENVRFLEGYTKDIRKHTCSATIDNPFDHEDESLYKEETKFLNIFSLKIRESNGKHLKNISDDSEEFIDITKAIQVKYDIQKEMNFDQTNLEMVLSIKHMDYLTQKFHLLKHARCINGA